VFLSFGILPSAGRPRLHSGDENGSVLASVFPQREEILMNRLGVSGVALHRVGAGEAQVRQCPGPAVRDDAALAEDSLEFDYGSISFADARYASPRTYTE
jgi:hypothetical protein